MNDINTAKLLAVLPITVQVGEWELAGNRMSPSDCCGARTLKHLARELGIKREKIKFGVIEGSIGEVDVLLSRNMMELDEPAEVTITLSRTWRNEDLLKTLME